MKARKVVAAVVLFVCIVAPAVLFAPTILTTEDIVKKADVIVLLGGGDGDKVFRAAELFHESAAPEIIVSGRGDCRPIVKRLRMTSIPAAAVIPECLSSTTEENASFVEPLLKSRSVKTAILVTSWYHSRRAGAVFRHHIPDVRWIVAPAYHTTATDEGPSASTVGLVLMEYVKLAWYALRYGIVLH